MNLETIFNSYGLIILAIIGIRIIYFLVVLEKIFDIEKHEEKTTKAIYEFTNFNQKNHEQTIAYLKQQILLLDKISKALEQESEPYIIENENEDT